eukprot:TRINITY_DN77083_c0_g1_i1.p1 TRINITY_DN77083_c0_g1~~TRINITY_DN77083_c0_g1_i1.p1  ORF type:complete len:241 (-),score=61.63 TRINITY_DN77083_c0_g1_i1:94-771(-)
MAIPKGCVMLLLSLLSIAQASDQEAAGQLRGQQATKDAGGAAPTPAPGKCCYSGPKDCDGGKDWCSKNQDQCTTCGGTFYGGSSASEPAVLLAAADMGQAKQAHESLESQAKAKKDEAEPSLDSKAKEEGADPPSDATGKCCYSGPKDCDSGKDWCSKNQDQCTTCGGTFYGSSSSDAPLLLAVSGRRYMATALGLVAVMALSLGAVLFKAHSRQTIVPPTAALG